MSLRRQRPTSFRLTEAAPKTKTDLIFPAFPSRFVDFAVQFPAFAVTFHSTRSDARVRFDSGAIFLDQHNSLLRIATNEIASF